jgi:hypothetical protein
MLNSGNSFYQADAELCTEFRLAASLAPDDGTNVRLMDAANPIIAPMAAPLIYRQLLSIYFPYNL